MPELPEVETTLRGILPHVKNQAVAQILVREPRLRWPVPETLQENLLGLEIEKMERRGKYLLFYTQHGALIIHLGMSGSLRVLQESRPAGKHDHVDMIFKNGILLRYNDPRRFGSILWTNSDPHEHVLLNPLGPEPLLPEFDGAYLYRQASGRITPVKSFIMDSRTVVGVGNIYANEALFLAGIHPARPAGRIALARHIKLAESIKTVLQHAIEQGGTTLRNFVNEAGNPGYFKQQLNVYGRGEEPCRRCLRPLNETRITNRTTVFCPSCQK